MAQEDLEPCPKCGEGRMRPTGKVGTDRGKGINKPFSEGGIARRYQCDQCGHVQFNTSIGESMKIGESLNVSVETAEEKNDQSHR
jgi:hypothetical protein